MINGQSVWLQTVERRYGYRQRDGVTERRWIYQFLTETVSSERRSGGA